jgi:tetratricopeptide (TPR) repeat protein
LVALPDNDRLRQHDRRTRRIAVVITLVVMTAIWGGANLDRLGRWFMREDHVIEAIYCYEMMISLSSLFNSGAEYRKLSALDDLADCYERMERYDDAIKTETRARNLVLQLEGGNSSNLCLANAHIAQFMLDKKDYAAAELQLAQTLSAANKLSPPSPWVKAYAMSVLMDTYLKQKKYADAERVGLLILPLEDRMVRETTYSGYDTRLRLARIYCETNRLPEAEQTARDALAVAETVPRPFVKAAAYDVLGRVYAFEGKRDGARQQFDQAAKLIMQSVGAKTEKALYWRARFDKELNQKNPFGE